MLCCEQRTFWLDTQSATLSWGKSLYAKSAKSARLLAALPVRSLLNDFVNDHLRNETVRALAASPAVGAQRLDEYVAPIPIVRYRVAFQPRVAVRATPSLQKVMEIEDAYGIAVFAGSLSSGAFSLAAGSMVSVAAVVLGVAVWVV